SAPNLRAFMQNPKITIFAAMQTGNLRKIFLRPQTILVVFSLLAVIAAMQSYFVSKSQAPEARKFNDVYLIYKHSHFHLLEQENLYAYHPEDHVNRYKYSPTFALLFGMLSDLPDLMGMLIWSLLTSTVVFLAIRRLPGLNEIQRLALSGFILLELMNNLQSSQANALLAGMLVLAFCHFERGKVHWATLLIVATGFLKIFGIGMLVFILFYPEKRKAIGYSILWIGLLALLPAPFIGWEELMSVYGDWGRGIAEDQGNSVGMSLFGMSNAFLGEGLSKEVVLMGGVLIYGATMLQWQKWKALDFRILALASTLIWVVIFNHKAESPSYVIAMVGIGIWYFTRPPEWWRTALLFFALIGLSMLFTDMVPLPRPQKDWLYAHSFKTFPCLLVWAAVIWEMWRKNMIFTDPNTGR
ncbi:MAG: glycosyltransferase family 87 protein, partial [Bacteroidota bacterium]